MLLTVTTYDFAGDPAVSVAPSLAGVLKNQTDET
jgi:hypothetical protein